MLDLRNTPWFIRVKDERESTAVQKWLFHNDFEWFAIGKKARNISEGILTNMYQGGTIDSRYIFWACSKPEGIEVQEIKFTFKYIIDEIALPKPTPAQIEARKIAEQIAILQKRLDELNGA